MHPQGLREGDVALVRERRDDQALLRPQILVLVVEVHVRDGDHRGAVAADVVRGARAPVEPRLLQPVEVVRVLHLPLLH